MLVLKICWSSLGSFLREAFLGPWWWHFPCCLLDWWNGTRCGALEGPGISNGMECKVAACCGLLVPRAAASALRWRVSSKQNFCMFPLFRLYPPTVLHATEFIRRSLGFSIFCIRFVVCIVSCIFDVSCWDRSINFPYYCIFPIMCVYGYRVRGKFSNCSVWNYWP